MLRLLYGLGVLNDQDQTEEEEERAQFEKRQARVQAPLIAVAVSHVLQPQENSKRSGRFTHPPGSKTNKGECFKCEVNLPPGLWIPGAPRAMLSLERDQAPEKGVTSVPDGRGGASAPEMAMLDS